MSLSLYEASVPGYLRMMRNLLAILDKAEAWAAESGVDMADLLDARLAPDMFPLTRQIQIVSDGAKSGAARLAGMEPPAMADNESTLPELRERLEKTIAFVESVRREDIDGQEEREIVLKFPNRTMTFTGQDFLLTFSIPNFLFHVTACYALLRMKGAPIGKMDFLAGANAG